MTRSPSSLLPKWAYSSNLAQPGYNKNLKFPFARRGPKNERKNSREKRTMAQSSLFPRNLFLKSVLKKSVSLKGLIFAHSREKKDAPARDVVSNFRKVRDSVSRKLERENSIVRLAGRSRQETCARRIGKNVLPLVNDGWRGKKQYFGGWGWVGSFSQIRLLFLRRKLASKLNSSNPEKWFYGV